MSPMPKCQALHIVCDISILTKYFFAVLDVIFTLTKMSNFYGRFFTSIFVVLLVGINFYRDPSRLLDNSCLKFNFPPLIVPR